jgi:Domain of unknown function (DUF5615)
VDFELPQDIIAQGMKDPEVLKVAASLGRILVTHDIRTMPRHFDEFISKSENPGLILIPGSMNDKTSHRRDTTHLACF